MFIKNKNCEKCGYSYDPVLESCPNCKEHNVDIEKCGIPKNIFWLNVPLQLLLFIVGFVYGGMLLFNVLYYACFQSIETEELRSFIAICLSYATIFAIGVGIVCFNSKGFKKFLFDPKGYYFGLAFMVGLFILSMILNLITANITEEVNDNQNAIELYVRNYPVISLLIFGVIGPIVEEFTYRVGLFSCLRRLNRVLAYAVTIIVFGLIHFSFDSKDLLVELANLPSYLLAGAMFSLAYDVKGPMCSITAHIAYNLTSLTMILLRS